MKSQIFSFELITPGFCGGAEPDTHAEIRPASIRGQLRWWFRTLGGFKSISTLSISEQEAFVFGSTAGDAGKAGKLSIRIEAQSVKSSIRDSQELGHKIFSDAAYLTFPIQSKKNKYNGRAVLEAGSTFDLRIFWRGESRLWSDIQSLIVIFGHLGALGFRGRRAMGALAIQHEGISLQAALEHFPNSNQLQIKTLGKCDAAEVIPKLGRWLKQWRAYGRTGANRDEQSYPGFRWAKSDHDQGSAIISGKPDRHPTYRPALGLPIIQFFSSARKTVNWDYSLKPPKGRFASPVVLRPYKDLHDNRHALVIFVDAHKWKPGKKVSLNGQERDVSLELYEKMKGDEALTDFLSIIQ